MLNVDGFAVFTQKFHVKYSRFLFARIHRSLTAIMFGLRRKEANSKVEL